MIYDSIHLDKRFVTANLVHHKVESEDAYSGFGLEDPVVTDFFQLEFRARIFNHPSTETLFILSIAMSPEIVHHKRSIYTILDMLGDIGGLSDALFSIGGFFISFITAITGSQLDNFLVTNLFKRSAN